MTNEGWTPSITKPIERPRFPVMEFKGVLKEYHGTNQVFGEGTADESTSRKVSFNFTDVEIIAASEPYILDVIDDLMITWNDGRPNTPWGAFSESVIDIIQNEDINELVGKRQHWKWDTAKLNMPDEITRKWEITERMAWQVKGVEGHETGAEKEQDTTRIINMAVGKTNDQFFKAFLDDAEFRKNQTLVQQATDRELLTSVPFSEFLTQDSDGVWQKI